jgi:hypothetical protein
MFIPRKLTVSLAVGIGFISWVEIAHAEDAKEKPAKGVKDEVLTIPLKRGALADFGATPWYTDSIIVAGTRLKLALDNGADFTWVTSDFCGTPACNAHIKLNTNDPSFQWIDRTPTPRSFGPWGTMITFTGKGPFIMPDQSIIPPVRFFASVFYDGAQFGSLAWDGGIGFPSRSTASTPGSDFFFGKVWAQGLLQNRSFSVVTDPTTGSGSFLLGGDDPNRLDVATESRLPPAGAPGLDDIWGTRLNSGAIGDTEIPELTKILFWLDSGSSRFKGDGQYVYPLLNVLYRMTDSKGAPIFRQVFENNQWVGLQYTTGQPSDYPNLPNLTLRLGDRCRGQGSSQVVLTITPQQYSYLVQTSDRAGTWMIAIHRLDGIGGLLVGSTLMDLIYSRFVYGGTGQNFTQDYTYIYEKRNSGPGLTFACQPLTASTP